MRRLAPAAVGALLLLAPPAAAAEELTLAAAMTRAREQARDVAAARARAEAGAHRLRQARAYRLPTVSLQELWIRTDSPAEAFGLLLNQERFSLPDFAAGDPNHPDPTENALTRLEVTLPVYTGGELSARVRQAALAADAALDGAAWSADRAALAAAEAYVRLAQAREYVALLESSLATVDAHARLAGAYVDQGMLVRSELLRAEVERARLADLLSQARGQAEIAERGLSLRLAADPATRWRLEPLAAPEPLTEELDAWLATAASRADLRAATGMLATRELEADVQRAARRPRVGVVVRRDLNDDAPFGTSGDSTALLAVAGIELFGGASHRAGEAAARAEADAVRSEVDQFRDAVRLAVEGAYEQAVSARQRHATALAAQETAREVERIAGERFAQGVVGMIDLLDAATARREAESRELVARVEAHLASLDLALQAGRRPESALTTGGDDASAHREEDRNPERTHS